jgi:hypothetical protein
MSVHHFGIHRVKNYVKVNTGEKSTPYKHYWYSEPTKMCEQEKDKNLKTGKWEDANKFCYSVFLSTLDAVQ